jgi:5-methylcytosine-specific restriction endonuclease McrA
LKTPLKILEKNKRWRLRHPVQVKAINQSYYSKNSRKIKAKVRRYKKQNKKKVNASNKKWRAKNKTKVKEIGRKYYLKHPDKARTNCVKRRALKRKATIGDLTEIAKIYARARELRQWFNVVVDHKIPLSKGGAHSPENLQIIYAYENAQKHNSLTYKPKIIFK